MHASTPHTALYGQVISVCALSGHGGCRQHSHTAAVQPWDKGRERSSSWQDYRSSPAADAFDCGPEAAEDAPLPAALEALVLRRVHAQFACSSRACLGYGDTCLVLPA